MNMEAMVNVAGWDSLDAAPAARIGETETQRRDRIARVMAEADIIAAPFRTPEGQACLSRLLDMVREKPAVLLPVHAFSAEQQALHAANWQGQMGILNVIRNALAARDPDAKKLET